MENSEHRLGHSEVWKTGGKSREPRENREIWGPCI